MRWCLLAAALVLAGASQTAGAGPIWREQSEKVLEVQGFGTLEIVNSRGRVDVVPSPDGRLHLTALKIVRVTDQERAHELARRIVVEAGVRGDRYLVEVRYRGRSHVRIGFWDVIRYGGRTFPRSEVHIAAQVPRGLAVSVRETSGDIRSEGIAGGQRLRSTSGDIEVVSAGGRVEASSTSGDVTATRLREGRVRSTSGDLVIRETSGPLWASTTSGAITVLGAGDTLVLSSASGDIRADQAPRGLDAETTSGDLSARQVSGRVRVGTASGSVRLALREPLGGVEASSSSGDIRVTLDRGVRCALEMRTSSGSLGVDLPMKMRTVSRRSVRGSIGGGTTPVVLRTASGDIVVSGGVD